jgi:hypothetical protein
VQPPSATPRTATSPGISDVSFVKRPRKLVTSFGRTRGAPLTDQTTRQT